MQELAQIKQLLEENPESPLANLLEGAFSDRTGDAPSTTKKHVAVLSALVGLLRAQTREAMQLAIIQLHSLCKPLAGPVGAPSANPSRAAAPAVEMAISPVALSALLTPSGTGYRVDFEAALDAMKDEAEQLQEEGGPLDEASILAMISSPREQSALLGTEPPDSARPGRERRGLVRRGSAKRPFPAVQAAAGEGPPALKRRRNSSDSGLLPTEPPGDSTPTSPALIRPSSESSSESSFAELKEQSLPETGAKAVGGVSGVDVPKSERQRSVNLPPGRPALPELTVDESSASHGGSGPPSAFFPHSLSQMPLSALLSATGFKMSSFSPRAIADVSASSKPSSKDPSYFGISASMLGLSPKSVSGFVGGDTAAGLLVEALASPLGKQLSASRRSPRFSNMSRHLSPLSHYGGS